jgi:hypothetical protein
MLRRKIVYFQTRKWRLILLFLGSNIHFAKFKTNHLKLVFVQAGILRASVARTVGSIQKAMLFTNLLQKRVENRVFFTFENDVLFYSTYFRFEHPLCKFKTNFLK